MRKKRTLKLMTHRREGAFSDYDGTWENESVNLEREVGEITLDDGGSDDPYGKLHDGDLRDLYSAFAADGS
jgi:hypothetical protein